LGVVAIDEALTTAADQGLDLVEVAPNARPPVCRIMDYGKFRYDQKKKDRESRKKQVTIDVKEVKLRPQTDDHDLEFKLNNARRFLKKGKKVKVTVRYRGREMRRPELGRQMMSHVAEALDEIATIESRSDRIEGRQLTMMLAPA
jgi:translation initiation factor IF-3